MNKCTVIIPVYRAEKDILSALLKAIAPYHVILVHNGGYMPAPSGSFEMMSIPEKSGYAKAVNCGLTQSIDEGFEWSIVMNQDMKADGAAIKTLISDVAQCSPGLAGIYPGKLDPVRWSTILDEKHPWEGGQAHYLSGSLLAIHSKVIAKTGYFDEEYFSYYEDADYSVRASRAGYPLQVLRNSGITHYHHREQTLSDESYQYYLARNHLRFVEKLAPVSVKIHELIRLPKSYWEYKSAGNRGGEQGIKHYMLRKSGRRAGE